MDEKVLNFDINKTEEEANTAVDVNVDENLLEMAGFGNFGAFLSLDEETFAILAPVVLEQLDKSIQDSNVRRSLYINFLSSGGNIQDIRGFYANFVDVVEKELNSDLSQQKIDFLKVMVAIMANGIETAGAEAERLVTIPIEIINKDAKMPTYARNVERV